MPRRLSRKVGLALVVAAPLLGLVGLVNGILTACEPPSPGVPCVPRTTVHWLWGWTTFGAAAALAITGATAAALGRGTLSPTPADTRRGYVALLVFCLGLGLLVPTLLAGSTTTCTIGLAADGATAGTTCSTPPPDFSLVLGAAGALALVGAWGLAYRGALAMASLAAAGPQEPGAPSEPDTV